jgi:hypothetical protein
MGVDYQEVGGMGIVLTDCMIDVCIAKGLFTRKEYNLDFIECFHKIGLSVLEAGDYCYSGDLEDRRLYIVMCGNNLDDILLNYKDFISQIDSIFELVINISDIKIISDIYVY